MSLVTFQYNLGMDADNFIRGTKAVNSNEPTTLQKEFGSLFENDFTSDKVQKFLSDRKKKFEINFQQKAAEFSNVWATIENDFISRCENLFHIKLAEPVIAFLSQNQRCTYNWRSNYFFVYYASTDPYPTVMHELLHFYTHRKYEALIRDSKKFNDIKESLTVILNTEFKDLMRNEIDRGYPQHQEMRTKIMSLREKGFSIDDIVRTLAEI